ncbi:MAG TPA: rhodanese-like domain-containing protein [Chloroflexota bacterium]|nr:rhodanese-like domain-containing protein [Chloroflexota bacterium]
MPFGPRRDTLPLLVLPALPILAACGISLRRAGGQTIAPSGADDRQAPRIDPPAALEAVRAGRALLVDVRSEQSYRSRRAAGALLLDLDVIERSPRDALRLLPVGKQPILYCT